MGWPGTVLPFLVSYLASLGHSPGEIGLVLGAYGVGGLGGQPLGGFLANRFGRRTTLITGLLSTAACLLLIGFAWNITTMMAFAAALGLCSDVYQPAARALIAETIPSDLRPKAFGLLHWAFNVGAALSGVAAGLLLAHGFWLLIALDVATTLIFAAGIPSNPSQTHQRPPRYRTALHNRHLLAILLLILINATVYAQQRFALPLALTADGHPPSRYGLLITLNAILVVALQPLIMAWLTSYPRLTVLAASWALIGIGLALTGLATTPWQYARTVVIWSAGEIGMVGFSAALIADLTPAHAHATYQALYGWTGAIARVAAPWCARSSTTDQPSGGPAPPRACCAPCPRCSSNEADRRPARIAEFAPLCGDLSR